MPTPDHYLPLLYVAALQAPDEEMSIAVDGIEMGSLGKVHRGGRARLRQEG